MTAGRFERSSGDAPTGICDTDEAVSVILLSASLLSSFVPSSFFFI